MSRAGPTSAPTPGAASRAVAGAHLIVILAGLGLAGYAATRIVAGTDQWVRIAVWFVAAIVLHDLVAFPVYALLDRVVTGATGAGWSGTDADRRVPLVNHVRVPALGCLLLLVVFLPQISGQGDGGFTHTSGLTPGPYGLRWLVLSAALFALSAVLYAVRVVHGGHVPRPGSPGTDRGVAAAASGLGRTGTGLPRTGTGLPRTGSGPTGIPRVVVLGTGFAGVAALHALSRAAVEVVVVDRNPFSTFQPLLYQVATGGLSADDVAHPARAITAHQDNAMFRLADVDGLDPGARTVRFTDGDSLTYDHLVVATGVTTNYFGVPGAKEHALPMYTVADAVAVRRRYFDGLEHRIVHDPDVPFTAVVVGAGATGVEMAGTLAELASGAIHGAYPELRNAPGRVVVVERGPVVLAPFAPHLRDHAAEALRKRGVELLMTTEVREVRPGSVVVASTDGRDRADSIDGERVVRADIVVWAAGVAVPESVGRWGLPLTARGRLAVGDDLSVPGHPEVFVVGDVGGHQDTPLPQLAQPAIQSGRHAGRQIARLVAGERTETFHYHDKGTMATIGHRDAVVELPDGPRFGGTLAWLAWVLLHVASLMGHRNRVSVLVGLGWRYIRARGGRTLMVGR